jgi:hypothetical protein
MAQRIFLEMNHVAYMAVRYWRATGLVLCLSLIMFPGTSRAESVLFVGNSFSFGYGSAVRYFHQHKVTDLNQERTGGVAALFYEFDREAGLSDDVSIETYPGVGLDWHLRERLPQLTAKSYDVILLQSYSTLDEKNPGDAQNLIGATQQLVPLLLSQQSRTRIYLVATWARPDLIFVAGKHWSGQSLGQMTQDIANGYAAALEKTPEITAIVPVGAAFLKAIQANVALDNPYQPQNPSLLDLWTYDHYHASTAGYYLEALTEWGAVTGQSPESLGPFECAAHELGLSSEQAQALQIAAAQALREHGFELVKEGTPIYRTNPRKGACPE